MTRVNDEIASDGSSGRRPARSAATVPRINIVLGDEQGFAWLEERLGFRDASGEQVGVDGSHGDINQIA
jgi:hypothetical protein